jgi:hypothetical protein
MRTTLLLFCCVALMSGCASGPTHDYYNPIVANPPKFKGDLTIELVDDLDASARHCTDEGYTVIGQSTYVGAQPKAAELTAQAKRVHATRVIYAMQSAGPTNMQMHVGFLGGSIDNGYQVSILFLGK